MAILKGGAAMLIEHHTRYPLGTSLLQLGRQELFFSVETLLSLLHRYGCKAKNEAELACISDTKRAPTDKEFFGAFGFTTIDALDVSDFSGANIIFDLNNDGPPTSDLAYDCIYDGGTMEHVFHVPNFLRNIYHLLADDGRVIHVNPASNSVEHGFYSFSPCLYNDYYLANRFEIEQAKLMDYGTRLRPVRITAYKCVPPISRELLDGYLRGNIHYMFFIARKTAASTCNVIPQQGFYASEWQRTNPEHETGEAPEAGHFSRVKAFIKSRPAMDQVVRRWIAPVQRAGHILRSRKTLASLSQRYH
jgi:hypothetical protein